MHITHTFFDSPLGMLTLVATDGALSGLHFPRRGGRPSSTAIGTRSDQGFEAVIEQLAEYFSGDRTEFDLPLRPEGTTFDMKVWELLRRIPYGEVRSYGQLAHDLGDRRLARGVGAANGRNPIAVIVPCHRVIGADGSLVGYGGGLDRKRFLLDLEGFAPRGQMLLGGMTTARERP